MSGFMDAAGSPRIPADYEDVYEFSDGLAAFKRGGRWGFLREDGSVAIEPSFSAVMNFTQGLAAVSADGAAWGFIDGAGDFAIEPSWDKAYQFHEDRALVSKGGLFGFIDKAGALKVPLLYKSAGPMKEGKADLYDGFTWLFVDPNGKVLFRPDVDEVFAFSEGFAEYRKGDKWGYIDATGKRVVEPIYDEAFAFSGGLARVLLDGRFGYIDASLKLVIPARYAGAKDFSEGFAPVQDANGRWGFIDTQGYAVINPGFTAVGSFKGPLAYAELNWAFGYVDTKGDWVWKNDEYKGRFAPEQYFPVRQEPDGAFADTLNARFATKAAASALLSAQDVFTRSLNDFDRQARLGALKPPSDEEFRAFAGAQALAFSDGELARLEAAIARFKAGFGWKARWPEAVTFAKTTGLEELEAAYTRGAAVFLPQAVLGLDDEGFFELVAHELFHILSAYNGGLRDALYAGIGYRRAAPALLHVSFSERKLTNPDALYYDYVYADRIQDRDYLFLPLLVRTKDFDPTDGSSFFDYLIPAFTVVAPGGERSLNYYENDGFYLIKQTQVSSHTFRMGRNTDYTIHPEELLAENFSFMVSGKKGLPSPGIIQAMRAAFDAQGALP